MNFLALVMKVLGVQVYCLLMKFRYAGKTLLQVPDYKQHKA
jgi:hypothetical protein